MFFDISDDIEKLNYEYSQIPVSYFENAGYLVLAEIVSSISVSDNIEVAEYLMELSSSVDTKLVTLLASDFSLSNTFYGIMLSDMCDFEINYEKINNLLDRYDNVYSDAMTGDSKAKLLYYQIMIRALISNNYEFNLNVINNKLKSIVKSLGDIEDVSNNVTSLRYVVEIYSFLQIPMDQITSDRIKNMTIDVIDDRKSELVRSDIDLYIVDYLMQLNTMTRENFLFDLSILSKYDGFIQSIYNDQPDIYTTFDVYRIIDDIYCTDLYLDANRSFAERLMVTPGIYTDIEYGTVSLKSTYYGNIIKYSGW